MAFEANSNQQDLNKTEESACWLKEEYQSEQLPYSSFNCALESELNSLC